MSKIPPLTLPQQLKMEIFQRKIETFSLEQLKTNICEVYRLVLEQANYIITLKKMIRKLQAEIKCLKAINDEYKKLQR